MNLLFDLNKIIKLRHTLHQNPELSDKEQNTAKIIKSFLSQYKSFEIIEGIGGNGIACVIKAKEKGPSILFRCDMDALPIQETNSFDYKSKNEGVSHKCGHDGHMAIVAGLADVFSKNPPEKGQVVLLFQPAEEIGKGAFEVVNDEKFKSLKIDYVFALHNLPGFPEGEVVLRNNTFSLASTGIIIKLFGVSSHAGEPENGINPANAMADIIKELGALNRSTELLSEHGLLTIIHARLGEIAFGTSPGYAEIMATIRTYSDKDLNILQNAVEEIVKRVSIANQLKYDISNTEYFPATVNNTEQVVMIEEIAKSINLNYRYLDKPLSWSEDFAHFTKAFPGALFGLGSGVKHPQLHRAEYDFPDQIITNGVRIFHAISSKIVNFL